LPEDEPLDETIFEDAELQETFTAVDIFFRVINFEQDPDHPTRPRINYVGEMDGNFSIVGYVKLTPDDQIRWHFVSFAPSLFILAEVASQVAGNGDQPVWWYDLSSYILHSLIIPSATVAKQLLWAMSVLNMESLGLGLRPCMIHRIPLVRTTSRLFVISSQYPSAGPFWMQCQHPIEE